MSEAICANCEQPIPLDRHGEAEYSPLAVIAKGGYAWFYDDLQEWESAGLTGPIPFSGEQVAQLYRHLRMIFCHDCARKLWETFPAFGKRYGDKGLHPKSCCGPNPCQYSW